MSKSLMDGEVQVDTNRVDRIVEELSEDIKYSIIGELGAKNVSYYSETLQRAKDMESQGIDQDTIEAETGWRKYKGDWKTISTEALLGIRDYTAIQINEKTSLSEVISNNILLTMYPEMGDYSIVFADENYDGFPENFNKDDFFEKTDGRYVNDDKTIYINTSSDAIKRIEEEYESIFKGANKPDKIDFEYITLVSTVGHELQHVIQEIEDHPRGGSTNTVFQVGLNLLGVKPKPNESLKRTIDKALNS